MRKALGTAVLFVLTACATAPNQAPRPAQPAAAPPAGESSFQETLGRELAKEGPLEGFRVRVDWREAGRVVSVEVRSDGLAIWDGRAQFRARPGQVRNLAIALRDADFGAMRPEYGEEGAQLELASRIAARIGSQEKVVLQYAAGEQFEPFNDLVQRISGELRAQGEAGVRAASLAEALAKIADGNLDPDTLTVTLVRRAEPGRATARPGDDGALLQIEGRVARLRTYDRRAGYGPVTRLTLIDAEFQKLVGTLRERGLPAYPAGLRAPEYTDLTVRILDQGVNVIARPTLAGTDAHPAEQKSLDALVQALRQIETRAAAEGKPEPRA